MAYPKPDVVYVPIPGTNFRRGRKVPITQISEHHIVGDARHAIDKAKQEGSEFAPTFAIGVDGTIYQLVAEHDTPYTDNHISSNRRSITIEHAGGHKNFPYTESMYQASIRLHAYLFDKYPGIKPVRHRDIPEIKADPTKATACSGELDVDRIVASAKNLLKGDNDMFQGKSAKEWFSVALKYDKRIKEFQHDIVPGLKKQLEDMRTKADELAKNPSRAVFDQLHQDIINCQAELDTVQSEQLANESATQSFIQKIGIFLRKLKI